MGGFHVTEAIGGALADTWAKLCKEYKLRLDELEAKVKTLEQQCSVEGRFAELERHLDARAQARDESKRRSEIIPHSELQRQVNDLKRGCRPGCSFSRAHGARR